MRHKMNHSSEALILTILWLSKKPKDFPPLCLNFFIWYRKDLEQNLAHTPFSFEKFCDSNKIYTLGLSHMTDTFKVGGEIRSSKYSVIKKGKQVKASRYNERKEQK